MEQTTLSADMHPNPNPIPITASAPPSSSSSQYTYYPPPLPQEANVVAQFYAYTDLSTQTIATSSYPLPHGYYFDPSVQDWAAKFAVEQYASDPAAYSAAVGVTSSNGTEQLAVAKIGSALWTSVTNQPLGNSPWKERPRKTKVVQSAYCEICKVDCNSKDVLDQHKLGKKHKKNLEKLQAAAAGQSAPPGSSNPVTIGPQENPSNGKTGNAQTSKKKAAELIQDLETKRRKIVESGAAVEAVRTCAICNIVCNSETVFTYHLAGQKHNAMVRKTCSWIESSHDHLTIEETFGSEDSCTATIT